MEERTCARPGCDQPVVRVRANGRPPTYCGVECRTRANNARLAKQLGGLEAWPRATAIEVEVCDLYRSGLSVGSVATRFNVSRGTVERVLKRNLVARRNRNASTLAKRRNGGRLRSSSGYVYLMVEPQDPLYSMAQAHFGDANRYVFEHRIVLARHLGRPLYPFESPHHKNGRRSDNRLENLELWVKPQPAGQRPEDLAAWVVEFYPDLVAAELRARRREQLTGQLRLT
jgi:hypothetical protein